MNLRHPVDDHFKDRLSNHSVAPPMELWDRIDQQRTWQHKVGNHLRLNWRAYSGLCALLLVGLFYSIPSSTQKIQSFPISIQEKTASQQAGRELIAQEVEAMPLIGQYTTATKQTLQEQVIEEQIAEKQIEEVQITEDQIEVSLETTSKEAKSIFATKETVEKQPTLLQIADEQKQTNLDIKESLSENLLVSGTNTSMLPFNSLPSSSVRALNIELALGDKLRITDTECAKFVPKRGQIFFDFLVSPDIALREMSPKNSEYLAYVRAREATETPSFAYSAAVRMSVVSGFGFVMRTGLNYSQINETFNYFDPDGKIETIKNIYNDNGVIVGTDTIVEYGTRSTAKNRFQTLDLPIILGYELYYEKFAFSINAGPYLNLQFRQRGEFLSPTNLEPVRFSSNDPTAVKAFKKELGIGWYGSLSFQYTLDKKLFLLVEPYFKIYPKSFTDEDFAVKQRYFTTGLSVGIRRQI